MHDRELLALTHLQFLVLGILLSGEQSGRTIRQVIADYGLHRSGPAFYQLMSRMERDGMVEGWYEQVQAHDQAVTERRYRATAAGSKLWTRSRAFYESVSQKVSLRRWSNA